MEKVIGHLCGLFNGQRYPLSGDAVGAFPPFTPPAPEGGPIVGKVPPSETPDSDLPEDLKGPPKDWDPWKSPFGMAMDTGAHYGGAETEVLVPGTGDVVAEGHE